MRSIGYYSVVGTFMWRKYFFFFYYIVCVKELLLCTQITYSRLTHQIRIFIFLSCTILFFKATCSPFNRIVFVPLSHYYLVLQGCPKYHLSYYTNTRSYAHLNSDLHAYVHTHTQTDIHLGTNTSRSNV